MYRDDDTSFFPDIEAEVSDKGPAPQFYNIQNFGFGTGSCFAKKSLAVIIIIIIKSSGTGYGVRNPDIYKIESRLFEAG